MTHPVIVSDVPAISTRRWELISYAILVMVGVVVVLTVALTLLRFKDAAKASTQLEAVARADCARRIQNDQTDVRDRRDNVQSEAVLAYLTGDIGKIPALRGQLREAIGAVRRLPRTQQLVDKQCPKP